MFQLTLHPSLPAQTPSGSLTLCSLRPETRRWILEQSHCLQLHAWPWLSPSACTDLTKQRRREKLSNSRGSRGRFLLGLGSCAELRCTTKQYRGCGTLARTGSFVSCKCDFCFASGHTPSALSTLQTRRIAFAARTMAAVWIEIRLPKPDPSP